MSNSLLSWPAKHQWQADDSTSKCHLCNLAFGLTIRRHHCRGCGMIFCNKCSEYQLAHPFENNRPVRACRSCYNLLITHTNFDLDFDHRADVEQNNISEYQQDQEA